MNGLSETSSETVLQFGPYRYYVQRRVVCADERPLQLGSRALDILQLLVEHAGQVVSKQALIEHVWPTTVVEESNLRVHIAALRRALGDGLGGQRYISNVPLRGYCFVADVRPLAPQATWPIPRKPGPTHNLPVPLQPLLGRAALIAELSSQLPARRFLTLVGPGGVGKTRVAVKVAEALLPRYADGVCFIDLSSLSGPTCLAPTLAQALGLGPHGDALEAIAEHLRDRQLLLVLDTCEHLIDTCALLAEQLLRAAPQLGVLATSREPLLADGECVHRLMPLRVPAPAPRPDLETALAHCAVNLFVSCAAAHQAGFRLRRRDVALVSDICRCLDGLPLAIELATAQVDALGLAGLLSQLQSGAAALNRGRRTAAPRQQSLRASLDWSYALLSPLEQVALQRMAIFKTSFTLRTALTVIGCERIDEHGLLAVIAQLAAKSLLMVEPGEGQMRYRLLTTTRDYALEKLRTSGELTALQQRRARHWEPAPPRSLVAALVPRLIDTLAFPRQAPRGAPRLAV